MWWQEPSRETLPQREALVGKHSFSSWQRDGCRGRGRGRDDEGQSLDHLLGTRATEDTQVAARVAS